MDYSIIVENDVSDWNEETGKLYHFPVKYIKHLKPGTKVIYYKGKQNSAKFLSLRLSPEPHYFGTAIIDRIEDDKLSKKNDKYAVLKNFIAFSGPILAKNSDKYLESDHIQQQKNYHFYDWFTFVIFPFDFWRSHLFHE